MAIQDDDNRLLGESGYTGAYPDKVNKSLSDATSSTGPTQDLWIKLFDSVGVKAGAFNDRLLAFLQTKGATSNNLQQAMKEVLDSGSSLSANVRNFLTFGGVNEYGEIPAWSPTGDFEIESQFSTTSSGSFRALIAGDGGAGSMIVEFTSTNTLSYNGTFYSSVLIDGNTIMNGGDISSYQDGKLHKLIAIGSTGGGVVGRVGVNNSLGAYFPGVIANLKLTDTAGGDNRFYPLSGGRSGERAYELDQLATLGAELWVSPTLGSQWTDNGGGSYTLDGDGTFNPMSITTAISGKRYVVSFDSTEVTGGGNMRVASATTVITWVNAGRYSVIVDADSTSILFTRNSGAIQATISNISVKEAPNAMQLNNLASTDWEQMTQVGQDWLGSELWDFGQVIFDGTELAFEDAAGLTADPDISTNTKYQVRVTGALDQADTFHKCGDATTLIPSTGTSTVVVDSASATRNKVQAGSSVPVTGTAEVSVRRILEAP